MYLPPSQANVGYKEEKKPQVVLVMHIQYILLEESFYRLKSSAGRNHHLLAFVCNNGMFRIIPTFAEILTVGISFNKLSYIILLVLLAFRHEILFLNQPLITFFI